MTPIRLERKRSDFHVGGAVTAYTGSGCCCCCCCLHLVGAAIGGGVGMQKAWTKQEALDEAPFHPKVRTVLTVAMIVGFVLAIAPLPLALWAGGDSVLGTRALFYLGVAAFVPTVVFLPSGALMVASTLRIKRRLMHAYAAEQRRPTPVLPKEGGAYREPTELVLHEAHDLAALDGFQTCCPACWAPLGRGAFVTRCTSCDAPIERPLFREAEQGVKAAWRMTWSSCAGSFIGGLAGYAVMALMALLYSLAT